MAFTVTNTFELGDVAVMKVVDGPGAGFATGPFEVELACTFEGTAIDLGDDAVRVLSPEDGMTGSWSGLPMGAECGLTETEDGGATFTDVTPSTVTVGADTEGPVAFTVTNTFELGDVGVMKVIEGPGAASADGPFEMQLACTFEGTAIDLGDDAVRILSPEGGMTGSWSGLPVGAECGLTETEDGGAASTEVSPVLVTVGLDEVAQFTVTNFFEEPPTEPGPPTDPEPGPGPGPGDPDPGDPKPGPPVETGGEVLGRDAGLLAGTVLALLVMAGGMTALLRQRRRTSGR